MLPEATTVTEFFDHLVRGARCLFWWPLPPRGWLVRCEVVTYSPFLQPKVPFVDLEIIIDYYVFSSRQKLLPDGFQLIQRSREGLYRRSCLCIDYSARLHAKLVQDNLEFRANLFDRVLHWPHYRLHLPVEFDHPSEAMLQVSRYADELEHLGLRLEAFSRR